MTKDELRLSVSTRRRALDDAWIAAASRQAQERLLALPRYGEASVVCCYLAIAGEVETELIVNACRTDGKTLCVPAMDKAARAYGLAVLDAGTAMKAGPLGVRQPVEPKWIERDVDLAVVPGLAFDSRGGRVGHGGGHYDRLLRGGARAARAVKVGLAFDFQIFDRVATVAHDVNMDWVVTEARSIECLDTAISG